MIDAHLGHRARNRPRVARALSDIARLLTRWAVVSFVLTGAVLVVAALVPSVASALQLVEAPLASIEMVAVLSVQVAGILVGSWAAFGPDEDWR